MNSIHGISGVVCLGIGKAGSGQAKSVPEPQMLLLKYEGYPAGIGSAFSPPNATGIFANTRKTRLNICES